MLQENKFSSFLVEGPSGSIYEDLWTIRSAIFQANSYRFRFRKQNNGVWVEVAPADSLIPLDLFDGETEERELTRGAIATKLILDKPAKIRYSSFLHLSEADITKLKALAEANSYTTSVSETFLTFTKVLEDV